MKGKVTITYNWGGGDDAEYQACLSWGEGENREAVFAYSKQSWFEARVEAIKKFRVIPETEELVID